MAVEITDATFQMDVMDNKKVTLIDLWAEWCGPCRMMSPIVEELAEEYAGRPVLVGKLDVDNNQDVPFKYNVRGIPTFLVFKNGELKEKIVGAVPKATLKAALDKQLA